VGQWANDKFGDGPGELVLYAEGNTELLHYKGSFKSNKLHSYGTLQIGAEIYEGHFEESHKSGTGKLVCPGWSYEGMWAEDQMRGPGTLRDFITQSVYTGQMVNGKKDRGILKMKNGDEYHGQFDEKGLFTSYSELKYKNGNRYHGDFKVGILDGQGVMRYANGDQFIGSFKDGKIFEGAMRFEEDNE